MRWTARPVSCAAAALLALGTLAAPASGAAASTIEGTVTGPSGEPVDGVCVFASPADRGEGLAYEATTDGSGDYVLEVPAGDHDVSFNHCQPSRQGYGFEYYRDAPDVDSATTVTVAEGERVGGIDAILDRTGALRGRVVAEETGEALERVCVTAEGAASGRIEEVRTDSAGEYALDDLAAGDYTVRFEDCSDPLTRIAATRLATVAAGQATTGVDAALAEGAEVSGVVRSVHTGEQQQLVCVGLFRSGTSSDDAAEPDLRDVTGIVRDVGFFTSFGAFRFEGVPPGSYELAYNPGACRSDAFTTSWYDEQPTRAGAVPLTVREGESVAGLDATLTPLPSIGLACSPYDPDSGFSDVPRSNVHAAALDCTTGHGITTGRGDGTYSPAAPVLRGQLASFVVRLLEALFAPLPERPADAFDDDEGSVHERAIDQLAALGVVRGTGQRRFSPEQPVSRGQMATFLVEAYEHATQLALQAPDDRFPDDDGTTHEASIDLAATAGFTAGSGDGETYQPFAPVRRDQMASFLARTLDRAQRDTTHGDPAPSPDDEES